MPRRFSARRYLKRRELITLALSSPEPELPPAFSRDPEISEMDIWLDRLSAAFDGLRIVHLTDIHHSLYTPLEYVQRAVKLANLLHPDVIALTGDYVTLSPTYIWPMAQMLGKLRARLGIFAVLGNHDFKVDADEITAALRKQRIRVLRNAHFPIRSGAATLWMVGVDDLWWDADDLPAALHGVPARDPKILLCHNPMGIHRAAAHGIDFMISGHTHGGQVRLPVVGSLRGRSKLGRRFVEGWNRLNGTQIYVSRGIGRSVVPLRLNCPPEIACLCLRKRER
jgi:predicted MPP superfamily phosphohydrolase